MGSQIIKEEEEEEEQGQEEGVRVSVSEGCVDTSAAALNHLLRTLNWKCTSLPPPIELISLWDLCWVLLTGA